MLEQAGGGGGPEETRIGFGGARLLNVKALETVCHPGDVCFFGVDLELSRQFGIQNPGAASFVRENTACMVPRTLALGLTCYDVGIIAAADAATAMNHVMVTARVLAAQKLRPVLVGCDHLASLAAVLGVLQATTERPVYLYFDAHFDMGLHRESVDIHNGNFVSMLLESDRIDHVVNVGARSWTSFSPGYAAIPKFSAIPGGVPRPSIGEIMEKLSWLAGRTVYVSIDADVLDPSCAPNVTCQEPFGMPAEDLAILCRWIGSTCQVIGADLSELTPAPVSLRSEQALMLCLQALFHPF